MVSWSLGTNYGNLAKQAGATVIGIDLVQERSRFSTHVRGADCVFMPVRRSFERNHPLLPLTTELIAQLLQRQRNHAIRRCARCTEVNGAVRAE